MKITRVNIEPVQLKNNLLGYAEIVIDDCFCVKDIKILRRAGRYYIAMPVTKTKGQRDMEIAFGLNAATRKMITEAVIAEYKRVAAKR